MGVIKKFSSCTNLVNIENISDEIILKSARDGDLEALEILMNRYKNFVKAKARSYFFDWRRP